MNDNNKNKNDNNNNIYHPILAEKQKNKKSIEIVVNKTVNMTRSV